MRFFFEDERFVSDVDNGIIVVHDGDVHRLILEEVSTDDSGTYSIVGRNAAGEQVESHCTVRHLYYSSFVCFHSKKKTIFYVYFR